MEHRHVDLSKLAARIGFVPPRVARRMVQMLKVPRPKAGKGRKIFEGKMAYPEISLFKGFLQPLMNLSVLLTAFARCIDLIIRHVECPSAVFQEAVDPCLIGHFTHRTAHNRATSLEAGWASDTGE